MSNKERITLLNVSEVDALYARPQFNVAERESYFQLNYEDKQLISKYTNTKTKVYLILQLGYFKATQQFFKFTFEDVKDDTIYIIKKYFSDSVDNLYGTIWHVNYNKQKADILARYGYREWSTQLKSLAMKQLATLLRLYPKGNDTLREFFVFLEEEKIVMPSYRTLQDLFTHAFKKEHERLDTIMLAISDDTKRQLDTIIKYDDGLTQLNVIRSDQKDFSYTAIKSEVQKASKVATLYQLCKTFIPSLHLSNNAVRYYASLAEQYSASRLRKMKKTQQWLYVLCFIFHRYQEFMDNLISSFMFYMRIFMDEAKKYAKEKEEAYLKSLIVAMPNLGDFLTWYSCDDIDKQIETPEQFRQAGFAIFSQKMQAAFIDYIKGTGFDRQAAKWEYYEKQSRRIAMYIRQIICVIDFEFYKKDALIIHCIKLLREHYSTRKPLSALSQSIPSELIDKLPNKITFSLEESDGIKQINPTKFECYVYEKMYHQIDRGRLFCNNSVSYCSLDHDLVSDEVVDRAESICDELGYKKIPVYCDERLDSVLSELDETWYRTNHNIENGCNTGIKIKTDQDGILSWSLSYDSDDVETPSFFDGLIQIDIADIMKFMGDKLEIKLSMTLAKRQNHVVSDAIKTHVANRYELSEDQRRAYDYLLDGGDMRNLVGIAGSGKSYLLGAVREAHELAGHRVIGMSLAGKAAENLQTSAGIPSRTVASHIAGWDNGYDQLTKHDVIVIDEAGMLGSVQYARLVDEAHKHGAKLIPAFDSEQLQAINAGAAARAVAERIGFIELTDVRRQHAAWQREATRDFAMGETQKGLLAYETHDNVHAFNTKEEAIAGLLDNWQEIRSTHPDKEQLILAHTRAEVKQLNDAIREILKDNHELTHAQIITTDRGQREFAKGDRVYFLRNDYHDLDVRNGTLGTIDAIEGQHVHIRLDAKEQDAARLVNVNLKDYNYLEHGYAATLHKGQGATVDYSHILTDHYFDRHLTYVGMTRHRDDANLYWSRDTFPHFQQAVRVMSRENTKDFTLDYAEIRGLEVVEAYRLNRDVSPVQSPDMMDRMQRAEERFKQRAFQTAVSRVEKNVGLSLSTNIAVGDKGIYRGMVEIEQTRYGVLDLGDGKGKLVPRDMMASRHQGKTMEIEHGVDRHGHKTLKATQPFERQRGMDRDYGGISL